MTRCAVVICAALWAISFAMSAAAAQHQAGDENPPLAAKHRPSRGAPDEPSPPEPPRDDGAESPAAHTDAAADGDPAAPARDDAPPADPTQPSDRLRRALTPGRPADGGVRDRPAPPRMPSVRLRAQVMVKDRPAAAILEIEQSLYRVTAGAELVVHAPGGNTTITIRVEQADESGVLLHIDSLEQSLLLK